MHERTGHALAFNRRHMAGNALASNASILMVRVFLESSGVRAICARRAVAIEADLLRGLSELSVVRGPMYVVARRTGDSTPVHHALRKVISLHAILVRGAVREIIESGLAQRAVLQLPIVGQPHPDVVADWPVVVFPLDRTRSRLTTGSALPGRAWPPMAVPECWRESRGGAADRLLAPPAQRSSKTVESGLSS